MLTVEVRVDDSVFGVGSELVVIEVKFVFGVASVVAVVENDKLGVENVETDGK